MDSITSGAYNTSVGYKSLMSDSSGFYNVAIGGNSLRHNTIGAENVAVGIEAFDLDLQDKAVAVGPHALGRAIRSIVAAGHPTFTR